MADITQLGFSTCMGPKLREFVESQLTTDLNFYLQSGSRLSTDDVLFDWSESCVEGHRIRWLDGEFENFSGISVFDRERRLIAEGWMEFVETADGPKVFWLYLDGGDDYDVRSKISNHVPLHIWNELSEDVRSNWDKFGPKLGRPV